MKGGIKNASEHVELGVNPDPYQHNIYPGRDTEFLQFLCDALESGVSILDENLEEKLRLWLGQEESSAEAAVA